MGKLKIQGNEVRTDIIDDEKKASIVDLVNRKPPSTFPMGIDLKFDSSGGLTISFDANAWYVGAKMTSKAPEKATPCDTIEEALYKCLTAWNNLKNQPVQMPKVVADQKTIRDMKERDYNTDKSKRRSGTLIFGPNLQKPQKFFKPDSLYNIPIGPKPPKPPRNS
jgi:hypothetical protein